MTNTRGMTLIEVMIVVGIFSATILAAFQFFLYQVTANNSLAFQTQKEQIRLVLMGQFLNDPNNCKCLFNGTGNNQILSSTATNFSGVGPTEIGRYNFLAPGNCLTATVPDPFIDANGVDNLKLKSVSIQNIKLISGTYQGHFLVIVNSTKQVTGPQQLAVSIPIALQTQTTALGTEFLGCSLATTGGAAAAPVIPKCRVCIQGKDKGCGGTNNQGTPQCSPWVTGANVPQWAPYASDDNSFDPDCFRIGIECQ